MPSTVHFVSRELLALNMMGDSVKRCKYSLSKTIEMFSVAIAEICDEFSSVVGRYKIVSSFGIYDN